MGKTLTLVKMGCDFFEGDRVCGLSDCGNYRIETRTGRISAKNGREYFLSFGTYTRYNYRKTNKRTGAPLKKEVKEIDLENALYIDTEFEDAAGCWCDLKLEQEINNMRLSFTKADILKAVNSFSSEQYTEIEIVNR